MEFMCIGTWRPLDEEGQRRFLDVVEAWTPPEGLEMKARWVTPSGKDFVLVETDRLELLMEGVANWAPFIDYEIFPIVDAERALPGMRRATEARKAFGR
ncbi:MAG: DUF3303 family protein [Myxococcota bacterium]|nr:DUF3303 family protein [Myxococcota bacterium]